MKIIVAIDDDNGMLFNKRRQSKDAVLRERILDISKGTVLWMNEYTRKQFSDVPAYVCVSEKPMDEAGDGEYCFVEDMGVAAFEDKIEEMIIFRWNRRYPSDLQLDFNPIEYNMVLTKSEDFKGTSHEKITVEVWKRDGI